MVEISADKAGNGRGTNASSKIYILVLLTALTGAVASYFLNSGRFLGGIIFLILFLTFFIVESLFLHDKRRLIPTVVTVSVAFALPFFRLFSASFLIGFVILLVFLFQGARMGGLAMGNMVKIKFFRLVRIISGSIISAVVIFLSIVLILTSNFSISRQRVDQVMVLATPFIERFIIGFDADKNTGELLTQITENQLAKADEFMKLSSTDKRTVLTRETEAVKARIEESLGEKIDLNASVSENVHKIVDTKLSSLSPKAQIYWSAAFIAAIWLSVQSIEFIIYIPLAVLVFLVYELLFALGFAVIQTESRSKEVISFR